MGLLWSQYLIIFTTLPGWWFGTWILLVHIFGISWSQQTNSYLFQRVLNHQPDWKWPSLVRFPMKHDHPKSLYHTEVETSSRRSDQKVLSVVFVVTDIHRVSCIYSLKHIKLVICSNYPNSNVVIETMYIYIYIYIYIDDSGLYWVC